MSKILAIADIHINDYKQRNPDNKYRLYQGSRTVAQNVIKVGKQEGCDIIVMAGDIVEKSINRPYVQAEVKVFLDTVMAEFREGYIIFGNHDLDGKSVEQDISDACLGVMLPKNLYYSHQKYITIDGSTFGFSNWMPEFDLSWIPGKVDVLFTHATICYAKNESDGRLFDSQKLDETKFDLAICGDIHKRGQIGKYVSIGCTQRCKLGDPEEASGIVLDCANKSWKWVDLNPDQNLMKFATTTTLELEGWHEDENTWYVYKQDTSLLDGSGKITVDAWEEINNLATKAITMAGLQPVHQEVLKNIVNVDAGEVDFNFTLLRLHCENWRSIEYADINFQDGDKILIQGANGSGKSSLLSAIQYAFVDCGDTQSLTSLKPFVQFGKKDCFTEVEFLYQGNKHRILRGTKTYGLWINDEQEKYNDKRTFEADCRERYPFIKYMDAFMFNADRMSFLKCLSPERITEITSKFLKLNRIDTYNDTAKKMCEQFKLQWSDWNAKMKETEKLLNYINDKLAGIQIPSVSKEELTKRKQQGLEIQKQNNAWNQYVNSTSRLQAQIQAQEERIQELENKKAGFRDPSIIDYEIGAINEKIKELQADLVRLGNVRLDLDYKTKEYNNLRNEGNNAWTEAQSIGVGKTCSHCGQVIKTTQALENHKQELLKKVEEIRPKIQEITAEIQRLQGLVNNSSEEYNKLNSDIAQLNSEVSKRMTEKSTIESTTRELTGGYNNLNSLRAGLNALGVVPRVDLPDHFMETMSEIENSLLAWGIYEETEKDRIERQREMDYYVAQVGNATNAMSSLEAYIKLTGPTGEIFEEIFNKLSDQFSNNVVKYAVERKGKGNREHLSLVPYYNNSGNWVNIFMCSSGQRIMLDLDYMGKIMSASRLGLLILDEFLKPLDSDHLAEAIEMIEDMNIGCILLTSHAESMPNFYNKTALMNLGNDGKTEIIFK